MGKKREEKFYSLIDKLVITILKLERITVQGARFFVVTKNDYGSDQAHPTQEKERGAVLSSSASANRSALASTPSSSCSSVLSFPPDATGCRAARAALLPVAMAEELVLDTAIRDWVLVPLSVVMVLIGVLRYFVSKLMRSPVPSTPPDPKHVKEGYVLHSSFSLSIPFRSAPWFS